MESNKRKGPEAESVWNVPETYRNRVWLELSGEKAMATHSSVLAWGIPGTAEPGGLPPMGSHRVRHN